MLDFLDSEFYHNHSSHQKDWALAFLSHYSFQGSERVLDIGCGDGKISAYVAKQVPEGCVIGVDPSKNMIEFAKMRFSECSNLDFQICKAEELSFREAFDLVVSFSAFHWVEDQGRAFQAILKSMKHGATLMILCSFQVDYPISIAYRDVYPSYLSGKTHSYRGKTKKEYERTLLKAGFSDWKISVSDQPVVYKNRDDLTNWIVAWVPSISELNPKDHQAYSEDMARHICSQGFQNPDGSVSFSYPLIQITATR